MNTCRSSAGYTCVAWVICSMLSCAFSFASAFASPIPPDAIVQGVRVQDVSISPDGRYLAIVAQQNGTAFVMVKDRSSTAVPSTVYEPTTQLPYLPRACRWAKSARLVCKAFAAALSKENKNQKLIITDLIGDGFVAQTNREIVAFLDEHLPIAERSGE